MVSCFWPGSACRHYSLMLQPLQPQPTPTLCSDTTKYMRIALCSDPWRNARRTCCIHRKQVAKSPSAMLAGSGICCKASCSVKHGLASSMRLASLKACSRSSLKVVCVQHWGGAGNTVFPKDPAAELPATRLSLPQGFAGPVGLCCGPQHWPQPETSAQLLRGRCEPPAHAPGWRLLLHGMIGQGHRREEAAACSTLAMLTCCSRTTQVVKSPAVMLAGSTNCWTTSWTGVEGLSSSRRLASTKTCRPLHLSPLTYAMQGACGQQVAVQRISSSLTCSQAATSAGACWSDSAMLWISA